MSELKARKLMSAMPYVCPLCYGPLGQTAAGLVCNACGESYAVHSGIPILIPQEAFKLFPVERIKRVYDRAYDNHGVMGTQFDPEYSRATKTTLLSFCNPKGGSRVLDIGTGDGDLWQFAATSVEWHGIDISEVGIRRAAQRFPPLHGAAAIAEWLPYPKSYFDSVIAADTIEHTFDLSASLRSVRRVLVPGGVFAFSVPTPNSLRKWGYNRLVRGGPSLWFMLRLASVLLRRTMLFGKPAFQPIDRDMVLADWRATVETAGFRVGTLEEWPSAPLKPIVYLISMQVTQ